MSAQMESGINTYTGHFRLLINVCTGFGNSYSPQNTALQTASMENQLATLQTAINLVDTLMPVYLTATSVRQKTFASVTPLATRVQAMAAVLGLPATIVTHIREVVRKLRGGRSHKPADKDLTGADSAPAKHVSVSQTSFNEKTEHFNRLIDLVASQAAYTPVETALSVASLTTLLNEMRTANNAVMAADVTLAAARRERNRLLFAPKTGMMDTALLVKEYVKSVFGAGSPQYREVKHIKFRNR